MKNTKRTLLSIAIIAALPFTAHATQTIVETNTPAAVGANGTVKKAVDSGPYQTATIGEHDDEHIATTAYVKGAYNDAIAAINRLDDTKQTVIASSGGHEVGQMFDRLEAEELFHDADITQPEWSFLENTVLSTAAVFDRIKSQRVNIYTTWGDDTTTATTQVALDTASAQ